jgi:MFS transporter, PAT family, beta-lactamase induction signal transducer AmpG
MNPLQDLLKVFGSRKMAALLVLGFSSGLPLYLTGKAPLQAWLTKEGVGLGAIAAFGLVGVPYSLKFLWAPLLDRFVPPFLGRRRGWMLVFQALLLLGIALMGFQTPSQGLQVLAMVAVAVAFFSASQDIVVDAYRSDVTEIIERGPGASLFLLGYRIAILVASALTFYLAGFMPWHQVYWVMALLMLIGMVASWWAPEPDRQVMPPSSLGDAVVLPFTEFIERNGALKAALILVFIVLYKLGDSLLKSVATPFLLAKGLNFAEPDLAFPNALGIVAVIAGTLAGGAIMTQIGINRALWVFAGVQVLGNLSYVALAIVGKNFPLMLTAINLENFCVGLESAAFVAFMMSLCNPAFSVTQYALLSSLQAFSRDILVAPAGTWAQNMGWPSFFLMTALLALPGLLLLPFFAPWNEQRTD